MAALRAKRAARFTKAAEDAKPKCTAALLAAAQAVGTPRATWDEDYRERLAGTVDSSDDDEEAIVVIPPPTVKLDPIAKRVAWRKKQRAAAAAQAAELVRDEYPAPSPLISQPLSFDSAPKEDVDNEEQLLEEIEVEGEDSSDEEVDEEEQDEEVGVPDKEGESEIDDDILGQKKQLTEVPDDEDEESKIDDDNIGQNKQLTEESNHMETQPPESTEHENSDGVKNGNRPDSIDAETQAPENEKPDSLDAETQPPLVLAAETQAPKQTASSQSVILEETRQVGASPEIAESSPSTPLMGDTSNTIADSQRTADSSRATLRLAAESASTAKSTAWEALTCDSNENRASLNDKNNKKTPMETAVTVSSGALLGKFTKLGAMSSEIASSSSPPKKKKFGKFTKLSMLPLKGQEPKLPCPFIEDEAEDELDVDGMTQNIDSDDEDEIDALIDDRVVADTQQEEGESARLADFHRQWQNETDEGAIRDAAKAVGRQGDVDNDIDLSELIQRQKERDQQATNGENDNDDAASACGGNNRGEDTAAVDVYVENMFRDENAMDELGDDDDIIATPEERKREARALWKARRKHMSERGARDPHAISLLNLFEEEEDEDEIEANVSRLKAQLVAATPVRKNILDDDESDDDTAMATRKKKRKLADDHDKIAPEWQRRRQAMAQLEKRRRTATCLDNWTLNSKVSAVEHTVAALSSPAAAPRMKRAKAPPVGGSFGKPLLNAMPVKMGRFQKRVQADQRKKTKKSRAASTRKLFAALGERPKSDVQ